MNATVNTSSISAVHFLNKTIDTIHTGHLPQAHHQLSTKDLTVTPTGTESTTPKATASTLIASKGQHNVRYSDASNDTKRYVDVIVDGVQSLANIFKANHSVNIDSEPTATNAKTGLVLDSMPNDQSDQFNLPPSKPQGASPAACPTLQSASQTNIVLVNATTFQAPANDSTTSKMDEILSVSKQFYTWDKVAYYILATVYTIGQIIEVLISMWKWVLERRARRGQNEGT